MAQGNAPAARASRSDLEIVAVVNGDAITNADVTARGKLFAISTATPVTAEILERLRPQITQQLVDERLRLQESQRRHVIVRDAQIAAAIQGIEARNGMPAGSLRARLGRDGISLRTLVDQLRVQIGWTDVLRQHLGPNAVISETAIAERSRLQAQQVGRPEFHIGEIFIPISNPASTAGAERFADIVIRQLRAGAAFPVVAAQFSQSQTALEGGERGWLGANELDPEIAKIAPQMPPGAISNPIRVAGGLSIIQMRGKREVGREQGVALTLRQTFLPFPSPYDSGQPTPAQQAIVEKAQKIGQTTRSCEQMEAVNKANNSPRPADPGGEVSLANINPPQFRQLLSRLPVGQATQPLVSSDGVAVVIICSREQKVLSTINKEEIQGQLLAERVELASRQLQGDLRRRATIDIRGGGS